MFNSGLFGNRSLMQGLRLWLLAASLIFAQAVTLAHAAAHVAAEPASHVCMACLAGHNVLGAPPPAGFASFAMPVPGTLPVVFHVATQFAVPVVFYPARGPPAA